MRKRNGLVAKLGTVFLALLLALGLTGMGYGIWSDMITISGEIETGVVSYILTVTDNRTEPSGGSITCYAVGDPKELEVTVINANADDTYNYCGNFSVTNTGSLPLKMVVDVSSVPTKVGAAITDMSGDGIIDPTETESGTVLIWLIDDTRKGETFTVTANVVLWNQ